MHNLKKKLFCPSRENQPVQNLMFDRRVVRGSNFATTNIQPVSTFSKTPCSLKNINNFRSELVVYKNI